MRSPVTLAAKGEGNPFAALGQESPGTTPYRKSRRGRVVLAVGCTAFFGLVILAAVGSLVWFTGREEPLLFPELLSPGDEVQVVRWGVMDDPPSAPGLFVPAPAARLPDPAYVIVEARLPGERAGRPGSDGKPGFFHDHSVHELALIAEDGSRWPAAGIGGRHTPGYGQQVRIGGADGKPAPAWKYLDVTLLFVVPRGLADRGGFRVQHKGRAPVALDGP